MCGLLYLGLLIKFHSSQSVISTIGGKNMEMKARIDVQKTVVNRLLLMNNNFIKENWFFGIYFYNCLNLIISINNVN